jgi:hypothetical protein
MKLIRGEDNVNLKLGNNVNFLAIYMGNKVVADISIQIMHLLFPNK